MSALVSLQIKQPEWSKPAEQIFIGKDILELLSTSMYVEPLTMYREYIQNAVDAHDADRTAHTAQTQGTVRINIDRQERNIVISDNGLGLGQHEFYKYLTSIGGSSKRGTSARGFRGVGRLAGLAYCQELIFRSRPRGKNSVYELRWDSRKVRSLLRSADSHLDLATIIAETIETRTLSAFGYPEHFFEVELRNVARHRDDRLLNATEVSRYLGQVAPVPFHPDFSCGKDINSYLKEHHVALTPFNVDIEGEGPVYRPHRDELQVGGKTLKMMPPEMFITLDREGEISAVSWILHHEYLGSLPKSTLISGWRLRSGNIQVGENNILEELFPETRFNGWTVAETHVLDRKIVPNGRRDNYEHSAHFSDLLTRLTPIAKDIAHRCRTSSITRNALQRYEADLSKSEENIAIASKPRTPGFVVASLKKQIATSITALEKATQRGLFNDSDGQKFQLRIRKVATRLNSLPDEADASEALKDFSPTQRQILKEVIDTIYLTEGRSEIADRLVGKILSKLRARKRKR
jgi:molecular chaperone HtpG